MASSPFLAPCLFQLRHEIDRRWPKRDRSSDGWIGDPAHSSRVSDHNPDRSGMVHAIDVDIDGISRRQLLREVIGDPRVYYVISNRTIYSRTYGWAARRYTGSNPHTAHVHISARYDDRLERDRSPWFVPNPPAGRRWVDMSQLRRAFENRSGTSQWGDDDVLVLERALARRGMLPRKLVDGAASPATRDAVRRLERRLGYKGDGIPGKAVVRRLGLNPRD